MTTATTANVFHAVPTYMGPDWSLHLSTPGKPRYFVAIRQNFNTRREAEAYAKGYAAARGGTVEFHADVLDVTDPD